MSKKIPFFLGCLQMLVALSAIPAGIMMIWDPSGNALGMSSDILSTSPFRNFLVPGIFLFSVNGVAHFIGAIYSFRRNVMYGRVGVFLGSLLVAWIIVQVYFTGLVSSLQVAFFVIGLLEVILSWYPQHLRPHHAKNN